MDFDLNNEQRMLSDSLDRLMAQEYSFDDRQRYQGQLGGWSRSVWARYAELGLLGLPFAPEDGGMGGSAVEQMIVMEALGRSLALEPYLATVVLCGSVLKNGASSAQRGTLIPKIADGSVTMALAYAERDSRFDFAKGTTRARQTGDGWQLEGEKHFVLQGATADMLIVSATVDRDDESKNAMALFLVDASALGLARRSYVSQDKQSIADVRFDRVIVRDDAMLVGPERGLSVLTLALQDGIAAICAEAVGAMGRAHEITVDYLKVRRQFGVPIGSFQALQHRAVDMLVMIEQARSMSLYAAMSSDESSLRQRSLSMSAAKIAIARAARWVGQQGVQLHGGIGLTEECQIGHYLRRLSMIEAQFGDADHHLRILSRSNGLLVN